MSSKYSKRRLWIATIVSYIFFFYSIYSKINPDVANDFINGFGNGFIIGTIILTISDIYEYKVFNKTFWMLSMIFMPPIALISYMIQRDKLIRLGGKFNIDRDSSTKK